MRFFAKLRRLLWMSLLLPLSWLAELSAQQLPLVVEPGVTSQLVHLYQDSEATTACLDGHVDGTAIHIDSVVARPTCIQPSVVGITGFYRAFPPLSSAGQDSLSDNAVSILAFRPALYIVMVVYAVVVVADGSLQPKVVGAVRKPQPPRIAPDGTGVVPRPRS